MSERDDFLVSIADTIRDYREGDIPARTPECVERWIEQFPQSVQLPILSEMDYVLKRAYFSRERVKKFLDNVIETQELVGDEPREFWRDVSLLDIQKDGNSQTEIRNLFNGLLKDKFGFSIAECVNAPVYVYLDDVIFTGNRVRKDLEAWINDHAPVKTTLHIIVIAYHIGGQWYAETGGRSGTSLQDIAAKTGKEIDIRWWRETEFESRKAYKNKADVLWPTKIPDDEFVHAYIEQMKCKPELRKPGSVGAESLFSSDERKILLEREFLVAGAKIRQQYPNLPKTMRPLGGMPFESLGFGSLVITFRNCPNAAPLTLWVSYSSWYPLFPRVTNAQSRGI